MRTKTNIEDTVNKLGIQMSVNRLQKKKKEKLIEIFTKKKPQILQINLTKKKYFKSKMIHI